MLETPLSLVHGTIFLRIEHRVGHVNQHVQVLNLLISDRKIYERSMTFGIVLGVSTEFLLRQFNRRFSNIFSSCHIYYGLLLFLRNSNTSARQVDREVAG
jgi:hypothetical protein